MKAIPDPAYEIAFPQEAVPLQVVKSNANACEHRMPNLHCTDDLMRVSITVLSDYQTRPACATCARGRHRNPAQVSDAGTKGARHNSAIASRVMAEHDAGFLPAAAKRAAASARAWLRSCQHALPFAGLGVLNGPRAGSRAHGSANVQGASA